MSYIWGFATGVATSLIATYIYNTFPFWRNIIVNRFSKSHRIDDKWISYFSQDCKLYSEEIILKQSGSLISGEINLKSHGNDWRYVFKGEYKNSLLIGSYNSIDNTEDENGSITIKLHSHDVFYGYCTFTSKEDGKEVSLSPYVLVRYNPIKQKEIFEYCTSCGDSSICCSGSNVDLPVLLPFEVDEISTLKHISDSNFIKSHENFSVKQMNEKGENKSCCYFFNEEQKNCSIYEYRPIDCRLFPFDIRKINGKFSLVFYTSACNCMKFTKGEIKEYAYKMLPYAYIVRSYIEEYSDIRWSKKLNESGANYMIVFNDIFENLL